MSNSWMLLIAAGFFEVCLAMGLKVSDGFTRMMPTLMTIVATILSFYFLSKSLKTLPIGTAYAIWTSLGAAGTALCGCFFFGESLSILKVVFILVIIGGVSGLKFVS